MAKDIKVAVVDSALIVSFLSAGELKVLRVDMAQMPMASVEMQEGKDNFTLLVKPSNGAAVELCALTERKKAERLLAQISDALMRGASPKGGGFRKLVKIALIAMAVIAVITFIGKIRMANMGEMAPMPSAIQEGVPAPADSLIGK